MKGDPSKLKMSRRRRPLSPGSASATLTRVLSVRLPPRFSPLNLSNCSSAATRALVWAPSFRTRRRSSSVRRGFLFLITSMPNSSCFSWFKRVANGDAEFNFDIVSTWFRHRFDTQLKFGKTLKT